MNSVMAPRRSRLERLRALTLPAILSVALAAGCTAAPTTVVNTPTTSVPTQTAASAPTAAPPTATILATSVPSATPVALPPTPTKAPPPPIASPTRAAAVSPTSVPAANLAPYATQAYGVVLRYPTGWTRDPRYNQPNEERYTGTDGFFQVSASSAPSLDDAADNEAHHVLNPYGAKPTITTMKVGGQEARLILPSSDQPKEMAGQAALIIQSPKPVKLGTTSYPYVVLWADQGHIKSIASTVTFG